jgi:hypothetical protein
LKILNHFIRPTSTETSFSVKENNKTQPPRKPPYKST